jgi:hypothetical protein
MSDYPKRTLPQNNSIHLWFEHIAQELNNAGYEQKLTIGTVDVPWSKESVKWMFKKIARAQFDKGHTSELTTKELTEVSETLNRVLAEKGIHITFPSAETLMQDRNEH